MDGKVLANLFLMQKKEKIFKKSKIKPPSGGFLFDVAK